jgi:predicted P-loop ATPase
MSEIVQLAEHRKWTDQFNVSETGKALPNLRNVLVALRNDPSLRSSIKFDEMAREVMYNGEPLTDVAVTGVQEYLQLLYLPRVSSETVHQAIAKYASECSFHPVRDYLNGLEWDYEPRLERWLETYCRAEGSPYTVGVGKAFLIGAVARIFSPGCKLDTMMILEGEQGARKSTAVAILGGKWFSDSLPPIAKGDKDLSQHLRGKWFVEIPELAAMRKAEDDALKSFIARSVEVYRPPFARLDVREPRQCVFVGTTNKDRYLRDETGARRYWPVRVGAVDTDALERDRDQLFAEAVAMYRFGEQWWPDADLALLARAETDARHEEDAWQPAIEQYMEGKTQVTVVELLTMALYVSVAKINTTDQRRVVAILRRMGWEQRQVGKARVRTYFRPHEEDKAAAK